MMQWFRRLTTRKVGHLPEHSRLPLALGAAVFLACILTIISVSIYSLSGASNLDLSRPGFEQEREEVRSSEEIKTYDTTSAVTAGAIDEFLQEYDTRLQDLAQYGDFQDQSLDDSYLQLTDDSR